MAKQVKGYLAGDGTFFSDSAECDRYTAQQKLINLCETHNINPENFIALLNSWHQPIKDYFNADGQCKSKQANGAEPVFEQPDASEPVPPDEDDQAHTQVRDKDAPAFLEQSFGVHK